MKVNTQLRGNVRKIKMAVKFQPFLQVRVLHASDRKCCDHELLFPLLDHAWQNLETDKTQLFEYIENNMNVSNACGMNHGMIYIIMSIGAQNYKSCYVVYPSNTLVWFLFTAP